MLTGKCKEDFEKWFIWNAGQAGKQYYETEVKPKHQ